MVHWCFGVLVVGVCVVFQDLVVEKFEGRSLERACKVAILRSGSGLEGWKMAAWKPRSLQDGVEGAKLSPRWPKLAPRWAQHGSKNYLAWITRCAAQGFGPILASSWALLGSPWPFLGGPRGHLEANLGLRRAAVGML